MHIVLSASSLINLNDGESDLSRRCITYLMPGLSFREYLNMFHQQHFQRHSLQEILNDGNKICAEANANVRPLPLFAEYLKTGYYPFLKEGANNYYTRIEDIVNTTIDVELPQLRKLDVGNIRKIKSLLAILASNVPYTVDTVKLSTMAEMSRTTLLQYLQYLSEAQLINLLYSDLVNVKRLQKPDKIYLENPNLLHALSTTTVNEGAMREAFLINQLSGHHLVEYSKTSADFTIDRQYTDCRTAQQLYCRSRRRICFRQQNSPLALRVLVLKKSGIPNVWYAGLRAFYLTMTFRPPVMYTPAVAGLPVNF